MRLQRTLQLILFTIAIVLALQTACPVRAHAEQTFAVAPFSINGPSKYAYLQKGIQDMFNSRLNWADHFRPLGRSTVAKGIGSETVTTDNAQKVIVRLGCDYLIYGSVTIMGDQCSLDVRVTGRDGQTWPKTAQTSLDSLIPAFTRVANSINGEVFKKPGSESKTGTEKAGPTTGTDQKNAMNPMLIHNQPDGKQVYLNPQFRYAGDAGMEGRIRSQSMPYVGYSCVVGDADGDGLNEIFVSTKHGVRAYQYDAEGNMRPKGEYDLGYLQQIVRLSMLDINGDGYQDIVGCVIDGQGYDHYSESSAQNNLSSPKSFILNYKDGAFTVVDKDIKYFLTTARIPPDYHPALVGQKKGSRQFFGNTVSEMVKMGGEWQPGASLMLPPEGNVFNFTYLPMPEGQYKIIISDNKDKLRVYTRTGDRQYTTDEMYSGSSLGLRDDTSATGLKDSLVSKAPYYVPARMVATDLDHDDKYELLVNHPISVAAQFFERYRYFPQGEIHALVWDGVGLSLLWKTRRIKGSVADLGLADINNDGVMDLYVLINTHPGMLGVKFRRTILLAYPLDTTQQSEKIDGEFLNE